MIIILIVYMLLATFLIWKTRNKYYGKFKEQMNICQLYWLVAIMINSIVNMIITIKELDIPYNVNYICTMFPVFLSLSWFIEMAFQSIKK